jgi:hypothetical protein
MSFDPYLPPSPEPGQDPVPASATSNPASDRVQMPALLMMALGVIHLFVTVLPLWGTLQTVLTPADRLHAENRKKIEEAEKQLQSNNPLKKFFQDARKEFESRSPEEFKQQTILQYALTTLCLFLAALLVLLGGWRMRQLKSYGIALLASVVVAIPCISPASCCCVGEIVGLWSLWVLLAPDVRASFQ